MAFTQRAVRALRAGKHLSRQRLERARYALLGTGNRTALASFPRSGNTWVRSLIEALTGESTGSVYGAGDRVMRRDREGVVIKTHERDAFRYARAIHLVRNPFDAVESLYHYHRDVEGRAVDWAHYVTYWGLKWGLNTRYWILTELPTIRVRYEDLNASPAAELRRIADWLGLGCTDEEIQAAVEACSMEKLRRKNATHAKTFFRRGEVGASYQAYSETQKEYLLAANRDMILALGYKESVAKLTAI
ncbi:MAG: sulfotransferase domain-containing protein [Bacteroidota bacterium]